MVIGFTISLSEKNKNYLAYFYCLGFNLEEICRALWWSKVKNNSWENYLKWWGNIERLKTWLSSCEILALKKIWSVVSSGWIDSPRDDQYDSCHCQGAHYQYWLIPKMVGHWGIGSVTLQWQLLHYISMHKSIYLLTPCNHGSLEGFLS